MIEEILKIKNDWKFILEESINSHYFKEIEKKYNKENKNKIIYPTKENLFKALELTSFKETKVIILGQDPYHNENQAHGLSFSVENSKLPPSLKNIFKELKNDLNINNSKGDLTSWAKEGVLLLNSTLSVEKNKPNSHKFIKWDLFTDDIIKKLNNKKNNLVFILWGKEAQKKSNLINEKKHLIIKSNHPSPFSAYKGFFDSKPFSKTNTYLQKHNIEPINWKL